MTNLVEIAAQVVVPAMRAVVCGALSAKLKEKSVSQPCNRRGGGLRRLTAAAVTVLAGAALTGCGGDNTSEQGSEVLPGPLSGTVVHKFHDPGCDKDQLVGAKTIDPAWVVVLRHRTTDADGNRTRVVHGLHVTEEEYPDLRVGQKYTTGEAPHRFDPTVCGGEELND